MQEKEFFTGPHNPVNIGKCIAYNLAFYRNNPNYFEPCGVWCYVGSQGSGKTLSMIQTALKVAAAYPKCRVISNLEIHGISQKVEPFTDYSQIVEETNGIEGIMFVIDEAQVLWNCMESRDIPLSELAVLCQNRKDRRLVLATSQVYGRVAKGIREQYKYVIFCRNFFKYIQWNTVTDPCAEGYTSEEDGHFTGKIIKHSVFFHSPACYAAYDTYNKIERPGRKKGVKK